MQVPGCPLCDMVGGVLVFQGGKFRVIRVEEEGFPAFYRLVWRDHIAEFSDLTHEERVLCMEAVTLIEQVLRRRLQPVKINLAALGNVVPHLHWHVIARFEWDSHFPAPVWGAATRKADPDALIAIQNQLYELDLELNRTLAAVPLAL